MWPKSVWVSMFENGDPEKTKVVKYSLHPDSKVKFGIRPPQTNNGLVTPLGWLRSHTYANLDDFVDLEIKTVRIEKEKNIN